jgi:hypothetical protein
MVWFLALEYKNAKSNKHTSGVVKRLKKYNPRSYTGIES